MELRSFQSFLIWWYQRYGRHSLPWRLSSDPYNILVSELMLQQTQVERVIPKFLAFVEKYPDTKSLANASLADVLIMWQGLGYNRRAKFLWQTAERVEALGSFPQTEESLRELPGVGPYTAAAVSCFSYNTPVVLIETNVRAVFLHHFFNDQNGVDDKEILQLVEQTLDRSNPREWYWALMDYGSHLKKVLPNPSRRSRQYNKQSTFKGSRRQARGEILRALTQNEGLTNQQLLMQISHIEHFDDALQGLVAEGMVCEKKGAYKLAGKT